MKYLYYIYLFFISIFNSYVHSKFIYSCQVNKTIALTFDDGPYRYSNYLIDYLKSQPDVKVTFFTLGKFHYPYAMNVLEYQEAMKKAHDAGYQIASHTFNHKISEEEGEFKEALDKMDDFIEKVTGDRPKYLRAPKGKCDHECQERVDQWDYQLIQWDVDTKDWDLKSAGSPENRVEQSITILKEKFAEEKDNYLILMHDTEEYTVSEIVPWIIEESGMKEKGYRFVSVAECLGDKSSMYASGKVYDEDPKESHQDNPQSIENELLSSLKDPIEPIDPDIDSIVYSDNLQHLNSSAFSCKAYPILLFFFHLFLIYYLYLYL